MAKTKTKELTGEQVNESTGTEQKTEDNGSVTEQNPTDTDQKDESKVPADEMNKGDSKANEQDNEGDEQVDKTKKAEQEAVSKGKGAKVKPAAIDQVFKANPRLDVYYRTSDGMAFYTENSAKLYAAKLEDQEITKVTR